MEILILNKNSTHPDSSSGWFQVDEGATYTVCFNETLDSGVVTISNLSERISLEPFDIVYIRYYNITKMLCVDTYTEIMECVNPKTYKYEIHLFSETKQLENVILPNLKITKVWGQTRSIYYYITEYCPYIRVGTDENNYTYQPMFKWNAADGNLLSLKKFDDIECPEMQWNTPTLREVLNDLMMAADCIPTIVDGNLYFMDLTKTRIDATNNACINYVTRSRSSEDYISELQVPLVNVTNKSDNANNVVTKVEWCHLNLPDDDATMTTKNIVLKTRYPIYNLKSVKIMFPASQTYSDDWGSYSYKEWYGMDLMDLPASNGTDRFSIICEQQEWITRPIKYNSVAPTNFEDWIKYQNWSLYYTRGSNEISNLGQMNKWTIIFSVNWVFWQVLTAKIMQTIRNYGTGSVPTFYNMFFKVEYETLEGCVFRASKGDNPGHERVIIDNQTNSYVDSYNQGFLEYQKANRLGNEQLQINARIENLANNIEIMDIYEDNIIYQAQYQFYNNHIEINALATKNYILRDYFTGVKSKIRSWKIASGSEALTRHDILKYYCEFSYYSHPEISGLSGLMQTNIAHYFLTPLQDYNAQPIITSFVRTSDSDGVDYPADLDNIKSYYNLDLMSRIVGNSLVFTFEFLDNYWAGQSMHTEADYNGNAPARGTGSGQEVYIKNDDIKQVNNVIALDSDALYGGGAPMYQHRYTDDNGENEGGELILADGIKVVPAVTIDIGGTPVDIYDDDPEVGDSWYLNNAVTSAAKNFIYYIYQRPRVVENNFKWSGAQSSTNDYDYARIRIPFTFAKDSQEITNISAQFEFSSETNDICFSKKWLSRQKAINTNNNSNDNFVLCRFPSSSYNFRKPDERPNTSQMLDVLNVAMGYRLHASGTSAQLIFAIMDDYNYSGASEASNAARAYAHNTCFYLCDQANGDILLAFNNVPEAKASAVEVSAGVYKPCIILYMNILRTRNKNIYDSDNHYLIVDEI